ncbi:hypothetical protein ADIWIN_0299 [Winogradskyella psychrotolerans RS-3]|uniref:Uncharacterized protein n=1 Tax=Winogradskyella psychrotolerans RS-3 TaxID=641526 RepID=S7X6P1_9FLAO|nr:hypothetical protein [Winogradskyella psychrotolerans]EPR74709.1 hypothetical protein ADIWIN_0299 [Winogradskyella psychrotolerans RS-3]
MKKKLFLNSTDVHQITGLSMRSAQNMMQYIRTERNLGKHQVIGIFDFAFVFNLPVTVVFDFVNSDLYKKGPIDDEALRIEYQKKSLENGYTHYLYNKDFDICMSPADLKKRNATDNDDKDGVAS